MDTRETQAQAASPTVGATAGLDDDPTVAPGGGEARPASTVANPEEHPGRRAAPMVAGYEVFGELGRGGMGVVYHARQVLLNRPCALKMILTGAHGGPEAAVRFLVEAESVAKIQHPNVVQIHHIGEADGLPFFELEYVEGGSLDKRLDGSPWQPRKAAELVEALASGVAEAHRLGVLHRDLKPANILLAADLVPKITDFGLAKVLNAGSGLTRTESILGSPSYMAPEQAEGRAKEAGRSADVYSSGAILFELLTGRPPFKGTTVAQTLDLVKTAEPVPPSRLVPGTPRDLETIALKCLQKEPSRRYDSADALAADLRSFLDGRPIAARPVGPIERLARWGRRNPVVAGLAAAASLLLTAVALVASIGYLQVSGALGREREARREAVGNLYQALVGEARALRSAREEGYRDQVFERLGRAMRTEAAARDPAALRREAAASLGDFVGLQPMILKGLPPSILGIGARVAIDGRSERIAVGFEDGSILIFERIDGRESVRLQGPPSPVTRLAFAPDGRLLIGHADGSVGVAEGLDSGRPRIVPKPRASGMVAAFVPVEGGRWLMLSAFGNGPDSYLGGEVRDLESASADATRLDAGAVFADTAKVHATNVIGGALGPGGRLAATVVLAVTDEGSLCRLSLWDVETGKLVVQRLTPHFEGGLDRCAFDPAGALIAVGNDGGFAVFQTADLGTRLSERLESSQSLRFSPDGQILAVSTMSQRIHLYSMKTNRETAVLRHPGRGAPGNVGFSGDGRTLVSANGDSVRIWDLAGAPERVETAGHEGGLTALAFSPDGSTLASASHDRTVKFWDLASGRLVRTLDGFATGIQACAFSPDGAKFATGLWDRGRLQVWDLGGGGELYRVDLTNPIVPQVAFVGDADRRADLLAATGARLRLWRVDRGPGSGESVHPLPEDEGRPSLGLALSPDGALAACVEIPDRIRIRDLARGEDSTFSGPPALQGWHALAFRSAGELLYIAEDGRAVAWDVRADRLARSYGGPGSFESGHIAVSPDGRRLAAHATTSAVAIVDLERGDVAFTFREERCPVKALAWSPDSQLLAVGLSDGGLVLWDMEKVQARLSEFESRPGRPAVAIESSSNPKNERQ